MLSKKHTTLRPFLVFFVVAVAYYCSGRLGLLLAIPPGYATAIWLPAGVALAGTLIYGRIALPGVFVGSFLINLPTSVADASLYHAITLASVIGAGAVLQAAIGAWLLRRYVGYPTSLESERSVRRFLVLSAGSCCVNATVGVVALSVAGRIMTSEVVFSWWTWWVGDTMGAVLVAPIVVIALASGSPTGSKRLYTVICPCIVVFGASVVLFFYTSHVDQRRAEDAFQRRVKEIYHAVRKNIDDYLNTLYAINDCYDGFGVIERASFSRFVRRTLHEREGVRALEWIPRVANADRDTVETAARRDGLANFQFTEQGPNQQMVRAGERDFYFPVYFVEPLQENERALGFDLASNATRREALRTSMMSGKQVATAPVTLIQEQAQEYGFLVFHPIYRSTIDPHFVGDRVKDLLGFALGVFRFGDILDEALTSSTFYGVDVDVYDVTSGGKQWMGTALGQNAAGRERPSRMYRGMRQHSTLNVAGRTWQLECSASPSYLARQRSLAGWTVLAAGLLITTLLQAFLLIVSGQSGHIAKVVETRTAELSATNQRLNTEIREHERTEAAMRDARDEAEKANQIKSQFLANMSHEIRTPMNAIVGYTQCILEELDGPISDQQRASLEHIDSASRELLQLINDILDLAKIEAGHVKLEPERFDVCHALNGCVDTMMALADRKKLSIVRKLPEHSIVIVADSSKVRQIVLNLISNAVKFTQSGWVSIAVTERSDGIDISVADSGIGMTSEQLGWVFDEFTQADSSTTKKYGGTGLGLTISRKFAELHGGSISVSSTLGEGSEFTLSLPCEVIRTDEVGCVD